jgi:hypothetical protein
MLKKTMWSVNDYFMWLFEFVVGGWTRWWLHNTNPGYRVYPKFAPGGLANQIEIFKSN